MRDLRLEKIVAIMGGAAASVVISGCDAMESALCPPPPPAQPCVCDTVDAGSKNMPIPGQPDAGSGDGDAGYAGNTPDADYDGATKTKGPSQADISQLRAPAVRPEPTDQLVIDYEPDSWMLQDGNLADIRRFARANRGVTCFTVEGYAGLENGEAFGDRAAGERSKGVALALRNAAGRVIEVREFQIGTDELDEEPGDLHNTCVIKAYCDQ